MFVLHLMRDGEPTRSRDFGHVNQVYRTYPVLRKAKDCPIWKECIEQGFVYMHVKEPYYTYHKQLGLMLEELGYNREEHGY